jgi:hypothetical protein
MLNRLIGIALLTCPIGGLALVAPSTLWACAAVEPRDKSVEIASETALIVWDEQAKKEHFIRRASFQADVPYFGFLVPTPARPELAETPDEVFSRLEDWTKPEVKTETIYVNRPLVNLACAASKQARDAAGEAVQVLEQVQVGPFDATVLKASDTQALQDWLAKHNYDARPAVMKWLDPYVKNSWIITAFQIIKQEQQLPLVAPQAVRMSFPTQRPFFPYSEPNDREETRSPGSKRLLRIFLLANQRMDGALEEQTAAWPGTTAWAGRLGDDKRQDLAQKLLPGVSQPEGGWLTVFDDEASLRPGTTDLWFAPSAEQSEVRRPPIIHYNYIERTDPAEILGCAVVLVFCAGVLIVPIVLSWWLRRRA